MARELVIPWVGDRDEYVKAEVGDYLLMVEDVGRFIWWEVFYQNKTIDDQNKKATTMRGGMLRCLYAMKRHRKLLN